MSDALNLHFPDERHVIVRLNAEDSTGEIEFANPITQSDLQDIRWYVETYGAHSLGDPDDAEAARIDRQLSVWGKLLFDAVFTEQQSQKRWGAFKGRKDGLRLLTISTEHPAILILPWELLHNGLRFLFMETPHISIRRRVGSEASYASLTAKFRKSIHLLFVVSRPNDVDFIDPRADALPVLDAIAEHGSGCITYEFLRPPTVEHLAKRLRDKQLAPVDILHFDGHGVFNPAISPHFLLKPNTGYLLFENKHGSSHYVSAEQFCETFQAAGSRLRLCDSVPQVALVILSACQSATVAESGEEFKSKSTPAMGSIAARLAANRIPSVLAMTHSVLVQTTRALFGKFYEGLARNQKIGEALDNARHYLAHNPEKYGIQRGNDWISLKLHDWFLPALFQSGLDSALLGEDPHPVKPRLSTEDIRRDSKMASPARPQESFYGRHRELLDIERWFAGPTRLMFITGFSGQGKTALALEAGWWLTRTGMFRSFVLVDYSKGCTEGPVKPALRAMSTALGEVLVDANAAKQVLQKTRTLLIFDHIDALAPEDMGELLDTASKWFGDTQTDSQERNSWLSRALLVSRRPHLAHPDDQGDVATESQRHIHLRGLGSKELPEDALEWYASLAKRPPPVTVPTPTREALVKLFDRVAFHPLSISVLASQLKTKSPNELGVRLEQMFAYQGAGASGSYSAQSLLASIERLNIDARQFLPRLGVFIGGALESLLTTITGVEIDVAWPSLRRQLEEAALIRAEALHGATFFRFHPMLAPLVWGQTDESTRAAQSFQHWRGYGQLCLWLHSNDPTIPQQVRDITLQELPNLLQASEFRHHNDHVSSSVFLGALDSLLTSLGFEKERIRINEIVQWRGGPIGSTEWYVAGWHEADKLRTAANFEAAAILLNEMLDETTDTPAYERANTMHGLSLCYRDLGRPDLAEQQATAGLLVCDSVEQNGLSTDVPKVREGLLRLQGDARLQMGCYTSSHEAYTAGLAVSDKSKDITATALSLGELGLLAFKEGNLEEAAQRFRESLGLYQRLNDPGHEAVSWHMLGLVFERQCQWDEAERHLRKAARLKEKNGIIFGPNGAAVTWNMLGVINKNLGRVEAAERWYRKIEGCFRSHLKDNPSVKPPIEFGGVLHNLANLLMNDMSRLPEARVLCQEALAIFGTTDPSNVQIWNTYEVLSLIAKQQATACVEGAHKAELTATAHEYHKLARSTKRGALGTRHELKQQLPVLRATIRAVLDVEYRRETETKRSQLEQTRRLVALRRIIAGERDVDALCAELDLDDSMLIEAILEGLADLSSLWDLLPTQGHA